MSRKFAVAAALLAVLALGTASAVPAQRVLVVEDAQTGETYLTAPVENGTTVALEYTHSVEKTRVYDGYTVDGDRLVMTRMEFESYGWGLPSGANVTRENGTFVYDPPGALTRLTVAPGSVADHRLHVGNRTYDLVALTDERSVDVHVTQRSGLAAAIHLLDP
ncbi:DUF1850 domain-containing protein [Haloarcula nitratireducens]|uniref:DUF1850 domain-containing protein n=1 Tax=Haloarcula nitratireducens TaxID=2487749 RepID=A0AAW4PDL0_9EURY|nr:DUF1850 domain-containing protein [Halomicroarcula nitratireducens]MBX0296019.1 DUF1850 domain-containing protein [Halomicroarcula nitratireducens]